jgi:uncharacterized protein YybS (DUF2232 family)
VRKFKEVTEMLEKIWGVFLRKSTAPILFVLYTVFFIYQHLRFLSFSDDMVFLFRRVTFEKKEGSA